MHIYVINLDKNRERLAKIAQNLDALGVSFERIAAVYGKEMPRMEKQKSVSRFKWWCARGTFPRDGEVGCALSHLKTYRMFLETDDDCCCVLEDDDQFDPRFKEQLTRIEKWLDCSRPQVVLMTNYTKNGGNDEWNIVPSSGDSSTEAYVITRRAAQTLLRRNYPACMPSDSWRYWVRRHWVELYHAYPTVVLQTCKLPGYTSDVSPIGEHKVRFWEMSCGQRILWKVSRIVGLLLARILI